MVIVNF